MPTFINIGQRNRPQKNYNLNDNLRNPLNQNVSDKRNAENNADQQKKKNGTKGWQLLVGGGFDHQFFDNKKLDELHKKESLWDEYENSPEAFKD